MGGFELIKAIIFICYIIWIIISHELMHYFTASHLGYNPKLCLIPNKKFKGKIERILNLGLPFPAVRTKNVNTYKDAYLMLLSPMPFGLVTIFLCIVSMTANIKSIEHLYVWLSLCFIVSLVATYFMSFGDFRIVKSLQQEEKNITNWFKRMDDIK